MNAQNTPDGTPSTGPAFEGIPAAFRSLVALGMLLVLGTGIAPPRASAQSLQPLDSSDLRRVSGEEGLREGLSFESLDNRDGGSMLLPGPPFSIVDDDTSPVGDILLNVLLRNSDEEILLLPREEEFPSYVFEYTEQPLFRRTPTNEDGASTFLNQELELTVGSVPEATRTFHNF